MKRFLLITLLVALALAGYLVLGRGKAAAPTAETSGISGKATLGPTCPVMPRAPVGEGECADKPYHGELLLLDADSEQLVKTFSTDEMGGFFVSAPAGDYLIRNKPENIYPMCGKNGVIPVESNKYTEVIVFCDTGIR